MTTTTTKSKEIFIQEAIIETSRLILNEITHDDVEFIFKLWNDDIVSRWIGNRGINDLNGAHRWIDENPILGYKRDGFGLWLVRIKETLEPIGMIGLVNRAQKVIRQDEINIGFSLITGHRSKGYCYEAAKEVMEYAKKRNVHVVGSTHIDNINSKKVLEKLGLIYHSSFSIPGFNGEYILLVQEKDKELEGKEEKQEEERND
ncbi:hypothetical protein DFA_02115 [Cavenderia fasciculata]|uniref:N-acetyltransferase domain-containing protein n=1 Tax=Cavenderia fasciculata TaxID=261658 RepID=F4PYR2_CACFS|nr:uncharacterized protein DFA_02115 [Cavenderia fasciculata]EGG19328.1 hypothetical protein DFA_02115 [Cavenderia fasciculata]|eukprot:XP_004357599.1 hypothetical protein DFA_02115 [Cavenderia fasciculata]